MSFSPPGILQLPGNITSFSFHLPGGNQTKKVHDFNYGLTYSLNEDVGSCNVSTINVDGHTSPDVVISPDGSHVNLQNPTSFFIPPNLTWAYEGKVNYSTYTFPSSITYFPVQRIDRGIITDPATNQSEKTQAILNIFAFDHNIGGPRHFDTSSCIDEEDQINLAFDLVGSENYHTYVQNNSHYFYFGAHHSIAKGAKLPGSRVAHLAVEEGNDEVLTIFFTLLGVPKIQGNAVNSSQNHSIPVTEAKENLQKLIDSNLLKITVFVGEEMKSLAVAGGSLRENFSANDEPENRSNVGATVLVAFATFFTGLFVGLLVMVIVLKQSNVKIPYLVQE
ncbi:hypothetical protein BSL78_27810 [Apostichopus japonicus]|uniref:Uncharacterized protein n=1 Tax=Stichopus japonicus TaxID=307972 RepID=A0A2G8JHZ0_STIJA|nr:hypothetical protein BSL78_27810 [Apostichopus japonicus]